jgi:hypothetical protein
MPVTRHPPYRSQACGTTALGSCLRSTAETLIRVIGKPAQWEYTTSLFLVLCPVRSTLLPATVCWSPSYEHSSPWPKDFSPRIPPVVDRLSLVVHFCSFASSILFLRPTSQTCTYRACGLDLPRPGRLCSSAGHPWDLPVSVQRACVHAPVL